MTCSKALDASKAGGMCFNSLVTNSLVMPFLADTAGDQRQDSEGRGGWAAAGNKHLEALDPPRAGAVAPAGGMLHLPGEGMRFRAQGQGHRRAC